MTETLVEPAEPMRFTYLDTDFIDAQRLHHRLGLMGRRFVILIAAIAVGLAAAYALGRQGVDAHALVQGVVIAAAFVGLTAILSALGLVLLLPVAARRQLRQLKEFHGPIEVAIDPPRIALTTKNGLSRTPTEDLLKWAEDDKTILLYRSGRLFNFLPKRVVSQTFRRALMAELARAGVARAGFANS